VNAADIALLTVIALSALVGLLRGFVVEVLSLVVWVVAFWLAFRFGESASGIFNAWVETPSARLFLGYTALFVGALVVGGWGIWLIGKLVKSTGLSGTDRLLGLLFGTARGAALCCLIVLMMGFTPLPQDPWWAQSQLIPRFTEGAQWMRDWLPEAAAAHVNFEALPSSPVPAKPTAPPAAG